MFTLLLTEQPAALAEDIRKVAVALVAAQPVPVYRGQMVRNSQMAAVLAVAVAVHRAPLQAVEPVPMADCLVAAEAEAAGLAQVAAPLPAKAAAALKAQ